MTTSVSAVRGRRRGRGREKAASQGHFQISLVGLSCGRETFGLIRRLFFPDMSAYKGHLSSSTNVIPPPKMSFPSSSPAANTFLVESLINACRTDSFYSGSSVYMPPGAEMGTYGMQTCGLLPAFSKRGEANQQNMGMNFHSYIPQIDNWTDSGRPYRTEPPNQTSNYIFSQNIKEESNCCMYSDKRVQKDNSSDVPAHSNVVPESCLVDGPEIPVPGYFRLSQTYAAGKHEESYEPPDHSPTLTQLTAKPQPASAPAEFADREKEEKQVPPDPDTARTPIPAGSARSGAVERMCSPEESASSPELLQDEGKGGSAAGEGSTRCCCPASPQRHQKKNKTQTALTS